jgi:hypothetical protein
MSVSSVNNAPVRTSHTPPKHDATGAINPGVLFLAGWAGVVGLIYSAGPAALAGLSAAMIVHKRYEGTYQRTFQAADELASKVGWRTFGAVTVVGGAALAVWTLLAAQGHSDSA